MNLILSTNHVETEEVDLRETGAGCLILTCSRCSQFVGGSVVGGPLILVMPVSRLQIDLDQLENEATP